MGKREKWRGIWEEEFSSENDTLILWRQSYDNHMIMMWFEKVTGWDGEEMEWRTRTLMRILIWRDFEMSTSGWWQLLFGFLFEEATRYKDGKEYSHPGKPAAWLHDWDIGEFEIRRNCWIESAMTPSCLMNNSSYIIQRGGGAPLRIIVMTSATPTTSTHSATPLPTTALSLQTTVNLCNP